MKNREIAFLKKAIFWEEKRNLFEWKINGIKVWEYLRLGFFELLRNYIIKSDYWGHSYYIKSRENQFPVCLIGELNKLKIPPKDILVVNYGRRVEMEGVNYSTFIDGLVDNFDYSYAVMESREDIGKNIITPNIYIYSHENLSCCNKEYYGYDEMTQKFIRMVEKDWKIELLEKDRNYIRDFVRSIVNNYFRYLMFYSIVLHRCKPKVLIVVGALLQQNKYMIEAAHRLGIPVIEYQHGVESQLCCARWYAKIYEQKSIPDYNWSYLREFNRLGKNEKLYNRNIPIGNVFHEEQRKGIEKRREGKTILFLSDTYKISGLDKLAVELKKRMPDYKVIFKLHPGEEDWRYKYEILIGSGVCVRGVGGDIRDISYYINKCDYVVGTASTALVEAIDYGKNVYIYNNADQSIDSKYLYENGYAELFNDIDELTDKIKNRKELKHVLYERNPIRRANLFISYIIKKYGR